MTPEEMQQRTRAFALRVIRLVSSLPTGLIKDVIGKQLLKCGTSVGANYRAACRAKSRPDFIAKMGIVEEEADEVGYWVALLVEAGIVSEELVHGFLQEGEEILAIVVASIKTARRNK